MVRDEIYLETVQQLSVRVTVQRYKIEYRTTLDAFRLDWLSTPNHTLEPRSRLFIGSVAENQTLSHCTLYEMSLYLVLAYGLN